ncbi:MAG: phospholipid/cholesterol/gamma-HCH transport system substrate-binding protein, partial [Thermoleophilaceae bacterium]|nr:phospholipid/cholesterol/gamma-HCH transport system substrate-binding protein [Thermoleophilaceae bacterium]
MVKEAPSAGKMAAMIAFALSCVAILLYLWLVFGGSVPLRPEGYRFEVKFPEATQLAQEADVRISGVNVGKVKKKVADRESGLTNTVLELNVKYAPIPADTRAILRQKTLLGETYVELTPGDRSGKRLPDGGTLDAGQVSPTVELDEIFRTFDPRTRRAFSDWMADQGRAVGNGGKALNDALGSLAPFSEDVGDTLRILDEQSEATRGVVRDTGAVFEALSERQGQLRGLVSNSNRVFRATAERNRELADAFVVFPTFLRETRATTRRLSTFAKDTDPLVSQLRPFARQFSPTLVQLKGLAPDLKGLLRDIGPLVSVSRRGLPALQRSLDDTKPLLARLDPFLRDLQPVFDYLGLYKRELTAFFANASAVTQATDPSTITPQPLSYLRTTNPLNPEVLAAYDERISTNRSNPYPEPGGYSQLAQGLALFGNYLCPPAGAPAPRLAPSDPNLD